MKRWDLINILEAAGWYHKRHGDEHDIYKLDNPTGERNTVQIPRHREINDINAK